MASIGPKDIVELAEKAPYLVPLLLFVGLYLWIRRIRGVFIEKRISVGTIEMEFKGAFLLVLPSQMRTCEASGVELFQVWLDQAIDNITLRRELVASYLRRSAILNKIDFFYGGPAITMLFAFTLLLTVVLFSLQVDLKPASYTAGALAVASLVFIFVLCQWEMDVLTAAANLRDFRSQVPSTMPVSPTQAPEAGEAANDLVGVPGAATGSEEPEVVPKGDGSKKGNPHAAQ